MNEETARSILGKAIKSDNSLSFKNFLSWREGKIVSFNGGFKAEELEAIVWWVRNMKVTE